MIQFEPLFEKYMREVCDENPDPSHDILHVKRVVSLAQKLAMAEKADLNIDLPGLNRSRFCDKIWAKKGPDHGTKKVYT